MIIQKDLRTGDLFVCYDNAMSKEYKPGQFHPSLRHESPWFRCHPAVGFVAREDNSSITSLYEQLNALDASHPWNMLSDERQDNLEIQYVTELLSWFGDAFKPTVYFAGGYEPEERQLLKGIELDSTFIQEWNDKVRQILTEVNVHELALVDGDNVASVYEAWSNLHVTISDDVEVPKKFLYPWV
jgi:hypothetical protein